MAASIRRDDEGDRKRRWKLNESWNRDTRIQSKPALEMLLNDLLKERKERVDLFNQRVDEKLMTDSTKITELVVS